MSHVHDDILHTLRAEHDVIRSIQELLKETSGAVGTRAQLWYRLKSELLAHAEAEEKAVYQQLAAIDSTSELAEHSIEEHRAIEELVDQLDHIGFDQPQWARTLDRLIHVSNHHLDEEEVELFPWAGRVLSDTDRTQTTAHYRELKLQILDDRAAELRRTTRQGTDGRTYESRTLEELQAEARERGIDPTVKRSEIISALRNSPGTDAGAK